LHGTSSIKLAHGASLIVKSQSLACNKLQETATQSFFDCKQSLEWNELQETGEQSFFDFKQSIAQNELQKTGTQSFFDC